VPLPKPIAEPWKTTPYWAAADNVESLPLLAGMAASGPDYADTRILFEIFYPAGSAPRNTARARQLHLLLSAGSRYRRRAAAQLGPGDTSCTRRVCSHPWRLWRRRWLEFKSRQGRLDLSTVRRYPKIRSGAQASGTSARHG